MELLFESYLENNDKNTSGKHPACGIVQKYTSTLSSSNGKIIDHSSKFRSSTRMPDYLT